MRWGRQRNTTNGEPGVAVSGARVSFADVKVSLSDTSDYVLESKIGPHNRIVTIPADSREGPEGNFVGIGAGRQRFDTRDLARRS